MRNKFLAIGLCVASLLYCGTGLYAEQDTTVQSGGGVVGTGDALTTDPLSQFAPTTSEELADVLSDETGTGLAVFSESPSFTGAVQINSTTAGFLLPRMTTTQRDVIASPVAGLTIYNTTTSALNVYTTVWEVVGTAGTYTDEQAQDAIGAMLDASLAYVDGTPLLQRAALTGDITASAGSNATTIANDAVTNAKSANMTESTLKGRAAGAGTGDPTDLTATQATALLNPFTTSLQGLAPASGGGTTNYLRADGTWGVPSGTGSYTDEQAQDAIGAMLDTSLTYVDGTPLLQRAALTGDVTASAGSNATTIAADAVTNAKAANMATATMKGRTTAGTGDPEDLTATQATALLNAMVGDSGSGGTKGLVPAPASGDTAANKFLKANGTWAATPGGAGDALVANPLSQFAATTSAQLATVLSNETGTAGFAVFSISPSLTGTTTHTTTSGTARSIDVNYTRSGNQAGSTTVAQGISSTFIYTGTNPSTPYHIMAEPLAAAILYGDGTTATVGSAAVAALSLQVTSNGHQENEHAVFVGALRYDIGTGYAQTAGPSGRGWLADFGVHGPIAVQPELLNGLVMFMNNYYNGSPDNGPSAGLIVTTSPGMGTASDAIHQAATTYPMDVGIIVNGAASGTGAGFTTGIRIGGVDGAWFGGTSKTMTGLDISGYTTRGLYLHGRHADGTAPAIIVAADAGGIVFGADAPSGSEKFYITSTVEEISRQKGTHATAARFVLESTANDELVFLRTGQVNYILGINTGNSFVLSSTDDRFASAQIMNITSAGIVGFGFGTTTPVGGGVLVSSPAAQTIAAGNTIAADACGSVKKITAAGAVTTSTTDTFSETWAGSSGCKMVVCNVGANAITLDNNARFVSGGITGAASGTDVVLGADDCVSVGSSGSKWYQVGAGSSNG